MRQVVAHKMRWATLEPAATYSTSLRVRIMHYGFNVQRRRSHSTIPRHDINAGRSHWDDSLL